MNTTLKKLMKAYNTKLIIFLVALLSYCTSAYCQTNHFEVTLTTPDFTNGVANLSAKIQFPSVPIWGWIEVTITSGYSYELGIGKVTKRYQIGHNIGGYFSQSSEIPEAFGHFANQWFIGDFDRNTNSIPIYHLATTSNILVIKVEGVLCQSSSVESIQNNLAIGPIETVPFSGTRHYMSIMQDKVVIGTVSPDEKLTVNGSIHSKEVRVDLNFPAPDYVFDKSYKLKSLREVEEFIKMNNHLPEIPYALEFEKNGLLLAEMNMSLLKKVEELTLYTIQQENELNTQNNKITKLEQDYDILKQITDKLILFQLEIEKVKK